MREEGWLTLIHDDDAGGVHDGVEPMGNGEDGGICELGSYRLLNQCICIRVDTIEQKKKKKRLEGCIKRKERISRKRRRECTLQ